MVQQVAPVLDLQGVAEQGKVLSVRLVPTLGLAKTLRPTYAGVGSVGLNSL